MSKIRELLESKDMSKIITNVNGEYNFKPNKKDETYYEVSIDLLNVLSKYKIPVEIDSVGSENVYFRINALFVDKDIIDKKGLE